VTLDPGFFNFIACLLFNERCFNILFSSTLTVKRPISNAFGWKTEVTSPKSMKLQPRQQKLQHLLEPLASLPGDDQPRSWSLDFSPCLTSPILRHPHSKCYLKSFWQKKMRGWKPTHLTSVFSLRTSVFPLPHGTTLTAYADICTEVGGC
jgi:hypothetical protein